MGPTIELLALSTCRAGARPWRSAQRGDAVVVVCKRTYALDVGEVSLSTEQLPIVERDAFTPAGTLAAASDLVPTKSRVDFVLTGRAYAPRGTSSNRLSCYVSVGDFEKAFEVRGERHVGLDGLLRDEARFTSAPIGWEHAAGGPDTTNPAGMGWRRDEHGRLHLPRIQPIAFEVGPPTWQVPPIGLGPVAPHWPSRSRLLGRHTGASVDYLLMDGLPADFDPAYFQAAPSDQQLPRFERDASIVFGNLHPAGERVVVKLAGETARCILEPSGRELDMVLDTVAVDTELLLVSLTWRASWFVADHPGPQQVRLLVEERGVRRTLDQIRAMQPVASPSDFEDPPSGAEALPFQGMKPRSVAVLGQSRVGTRPEPESLAGTPFVRASSNTDGGASQTVRRTRTASGPALTPSDAEPAFLRGGPSRPSAPPQPPAAPPPFVPPVAVAPPAVVSQPPPTAREPLRAPPPVVPPPPSASPSYGPPAVVLPSATAPAQNAHAAPSSPGVDHSHSGPSGGEAAAFNTAELAARARPPSYLLGAQAPTTTSAPTHSADSAMAGVGAASDAAASHEPSGGSTSKARSSTRAQIERAPRAPGFLDLSWYHPDAHERLKASPSWAKLIRRPPSKGEWLDEKDGDARRKEPPERIVARALSRGESLGAAGVSQAVLEAVDDDGFLVRPLVVVEGEVQLAFDPRETLAATVSFAEPMQARDAKIKEAVDAASELLKAERKVTLPMLDAATKRLRQTFAGSTTRSLAPDYLETTVERWLLDERRFHKRVVLGETRLVSSITPSGSSSALPLYLPAELEAVVPTLPRFKARVLAEPHARQDATETEGTTLLALAFARVMGR
jgi:hypothetical protein